jgi:tRNA U55 pseudouridine synthase TruB
MYPKAVVKPEAMKLLLNGNPISLDSVVTDERSKIYRIYDDKGEFYALYKAKGNRLVVEKNFH